MTRKSRAYPGVAYPASKAAVNMITVQYAKAFPDMRINAVEPGYTATDLNGNMGTQTVEEGAEIIVRMAQIGPDGPTAGIAALGALRGHRARGQRPHRADTASGVPGPLAVGAPRVFHIHPSRTRSAHACCANAVERGGWS